MQSSCSNGRLRRFHLPMISLAIAGMALCATAEDPPADTESNYGATPPRYEPYGRFTEPYERFFLDPIEYRGHGRELPEPEGLESVKIGFLGPIEATVSVATGGASHEEPLGRKMLQGAQLAVQHANRNGGFGADGIPFELVIRNDNGLWGASGNEIIQLAYRDRVWAILGTIDGANSHIAIRVALKAEVPVINTGDTDPTFVETLIPWVFRNITDDRQMSYRLADFVFNELGLERVAALRAANRYGRISIDEFRDAATRRGHPFLAELQYSVGDTDFRSQLERLQALKPEVIVTWGDAAESALILRQMREMGMDQWLVGSDRIVTPEFLQVAGGDVSRVAAGYPWDPTREDALYRRFVEEFKAEFGEPPETYAAHAYDGITMLVEAIRKAGLNRARIRDELAATKTWYGVTGHKIFDTVYTNRSPAVLAVAEEGGWTFRSEAQPSDHPPSAANKRMLDDPVSFTGVETSGAPATAATIFPIGLFAPDQDDPVGRSMLRGATLAVDLINDSGGIAGVPMRLIHRWTSDPWQGGSSEVVRMAYSDRVLAIIGGPDGASTHVAQQVATKAMLPLIAPATSDPSLTHTRVPWIFRLPPDDAVQARLLVSTGVVEPDLHRIGLITGADHDSRAAATELRRALEQAGRTPVCHLSVSPDESVADIVGRVGSFALDGIIIRTKAPQMLELVTSLEASGLSIPLLMPWVPGFDLDRQQRDSSLPIESVVPFSADAARSETRFFEGTYQRRWGVKPSPEATYSYDAVQLIAEALRAGATGRAALARSIRQLDGFELSSGPLRLDNGGGNTGSPAMIENPSLATVEVPRVVHQVQLRPDGRVADAPGR